MTRAKWPHELHVRGLSIFPKEEAIILIHDYRPGDSGHRGTVDRHGELVDPGAPPEDPHIEYEVLDPDTREVIPVSDQEYLTDILLDHTIEEFVV